LLRPAAKRCNAKALLAVLAKTDDQKRPKTNNQTRCHDLKPSTISKLWLSYIHSLKFKTCISFQHEIIE